MKTAVPLWTLLAYGAVGATTYFAADWLFGGGDAVGQRVEERAALQETTAEAPAPVSERTSDESGATTEPESASATAPSLPDGEQEAIAEGDEAVDEILTELELIYQESDDNFIPTEPVSPDTTIDFPVDI
ncbi:MAG: hypothetical protein AAGL69_06430 [Pseudomonadota bacterium]